MRMVGRAAATVAAAVLALAVLGALAEPAAGQSSEGIRQYGIEAVVEAEGSVIVTETIEYDFGSAQRRGIFRNIQTRFRYDDQRSGYDRVTPLTVLSIEGSEGTPTDLERSSEDGVQVLRIGDPDVTITGVHTYRIRYRLEGVLNHFADHDELNLNLVGTGWDVPIDEVEATVTAPGGINQVACFSGPQGSVLPCGQAVRQGDQARFAASDLAPGSGLTAVVGFPVGLVPTPEPILEQRWSVASAFDLRPDTLAPAGGLLLAVAGGFSLLAFRTGRDRRFVGSPVDVAFGSADGVEERVPLRDRDVIPVEFAPPDNLRPGQVGTLIDEQAHTLDVTATIVDLAARGYLVIKELPKEQWLGQADWELERRKPSDGLHQYEAILLDALFDAGDTVKLSELKNQFASDLARVKDALYDDVVSQGWFRERPDHTRSRWTVVGIVALVAAVIITAVLAATTSYGLLGLPLVVGALLMVIGGRRWFPRRTAKGYGVLRRVRGFKRFIDESEAERAQFAERQHLFSEYLPYAVVFGATEQWAKAFAGIDGELPRPGWYISPYPFTFLAFTSSMNGFAVTTSGTIASTPPAASGASGFSGGGFSGGGFGGGGGGSW